MTNPGRNVEAGRDVEGGGLRAGNGLGVGFDWRAALGQALDDALPPLQGDAPDLLVLFVSAAYGDDFAEVLAEAARRSGAREIAGCSASGVIAMAREVEDEPGVAALALRLPAGASL